MIHCYQFEGLNIVLDCYSGSIHVVDEVAYDMIQWYENEPADAVVAKAVEKHGISKEDAEECIADIDDLKTAGKLYAPDKYEHLAKDFRKKNFKVKALCLHVAHTCNLNCSYCFASQGKYHGERAIMSYEVGKRAIDFLIENSGFHKNLDIDFFGGEPLMNWDVVKQLVAYGREQERIHNKNIRFTLTTNGMLLDDEVTEFANREMHNVVLSLDGRKEVNDRFRVDYAGHGSYDKIVPNFQKFVAKRGNRSYYMRGTFTHFNTDFVNDIKQMLDLGFTELSMEPVVTEPSSPSAITKEDLPIVFEQYEELARLMVRRFTVPASIRGSQAAAPAQSISPSHRGATSIPATSSSATTHTRWVISTTVFRTRNSATGSHAATLTAVPNARTAGQSSTAPAVVRQIPITLQATSTASTRWDAISSERG